MIKWLQCTNLNILSENYQMYANDRYLIWQNNSFGRTYESGRITRLCFSLVQLYSKVSPD